MEKIKIDEVFRACCELQLEEPSQLLHEYMLYYIADTQNNLLEDDCVIVMNAIDEFLKN
ncbi:MAG: hypothetical protein QM500_13105 [Methylococcales bacterium]